MADYIDPEEMEMNVIPPDNNPIDDITQNDPGFSGESQQETNFTTPEWDINRTRIDMYREKFMTTYGIDDATFNLLKEDLVFKDKKIYYKSKSGVLVLLSGKIKELVALSSITGKGATEFRNIVTGVQRELASRRQASQQRASQLRESKITRQPITFDNPAFEDVDDDELTQRLTDLRTINAELRAEGEPELDSYVHRETLREMGD